MIVYIAGKITGDENYRAKFEAYAAMERERVDVVLNPAILPFGLTQADYMRICFAMLDCADAAYFIQDYRESQGAALEWAYCQKICKPCAVYTTIPVL